MQHSDQQSVIIQGKQGTDTAREADPATSAESTLVTPRLLRGSRLKAQLPRLLAGGLGEALWLGLTLRIALSLFALMASVLFPLPGPCTWENGPALHTTGLDFRLVGVWQRWDACWYLKIATLGYQPGDASVVFFPLYPILMRLAGFPLDSNFTLGGLVVSGVAYIAAVCGLYRLVTLDFDEPLARRTVLYLSIFPTGFFFFAPFSEALFLALVIWTLYLARRGAWDGAAVTGFYAGLTRTQGCLLAIPLAAEFIRQRWAPPGEAEQRRERPGLSAALGWLPPLIGFTAFIAYSSVFTGWTMFEAESVWGRTSRPPWTAIALSWEHIRTRSDVVETLNLILLLLFGALLIAGIRSLPFSYTLYAAPHLLLLSSQQAWFSPLMSTSRYVLVLFPGFVVLALLGRHRRLHYSWLILSLLLLGFLLYAFLSGAFVG